MAYREKCPVCLTNYIIRKGNRTCSKMCSYQWGEWTPEYQASRVKTAQKPILTMDEIVNADRKLRGLSPLTSEEILDLDNQPINVIDDEAEIDRNEFNFEKIMGGK